jgi:aspartate dehydrogenase
MNISIIGCGAIGGQLAGFIDSGMIRNANLVALFDSDSTAAQRLKLRLENREVAAFSSFSDLACSKEFEITDIVIEAASQAAVMQYGKSIVRYKKDLLLMSVGALSDDSFSSELLDTASINKCRIHVPTGAIAGLDAIRSVKGLLDSVTLTTTKNPKALVGAPFFATNNINLETITESTMVYQGDAQDAAKKFPANINVAVALGLAGIGLRNTRVEIIADPHINVNQHNITATGPFGEILITVRSKQAPHNPRTSLLAIYSALECLRQTCGTWFKVGS